MRAIDADALVEAIKDYPSGFRGMIVCDIAKQPTIDLIEITAAHEHFLTKQRMRIGTLNVDNVLTM